MSLRDRIAAVCDRGRAVVDDLGLRVHVVALRVTAWSGDAPGRGTATHTDTTIDPAPRVESAPRWRVEAPGATEGGEIVVRRISVVTYSEATLRAATVWRIDGQDYRLVRLEQRATEWRATLARMNRGG